MSNSKCPIKRRHSLAQSFKTAFSGIGVGLKYERNFRIHVIATVTVVIFGIVFSISSFEWIVLILSIIAVMSLELVNTALEQLIDFLKPEKHSTIGKVKDMVAGSVLITTLGSVIIGLIIFIPKIVDLIS